MKNLEKVHILGSGPGSLATALRLSKHEGLEIHVWTKEKDRVGGRTMGIKVGACVSDLGPTWMHMPFVFDELFETSRREGEGEEFNPHKFMEMIEIEPIQCMLYYPRSEKKIYVKRGVEGMTESIREALGDEEAEGVVSFMKENKQHYGPVYGILRKHFPGKASLLTPQVVAALPHLRLHMSMLTSIKKEESIYAHTFQSKYLGQAPALTPAAFTIVPYVEREQGVFHIKGGLNQITLKLAEICKERGVHFHLDHEVVNVATTEHEGDRKITFKSGNVVELKNDPVVIGIDFPWAVDNVYNDDKKWSHKMADDPNLSCSAVVFMWDVPRECVKHEFHHTVVFAKDIETNMKDLQLEKMSDDFAFYMCLPGVTDDVMVPPDRHLLYILVPCPNLTKSDDSKEFWEGEVERLKLGVVKKLKEFLDIDVAEHVMDAQDREKVFTPLTFRDEYHCGRGAVFGFAHVLSQMLIWRPKNRQRKGTYLAGGSTHPGSGLPTIFVSGMIAADLIEEDYGL